MVLAGWGVVAGRHAKAGLPLGQAPKLGGVAKQLHQRHLRLHHASIAALLDTLDLPAALI